MRWSAKTAAASSCVPLSSTDSTDSPMKSTKVADPPFAVKWIVLVVAKVVSDVVRSRVIS